MMERVKGGEFCIVIVYQIMTKGRHSLSLYRKKLRRNKKEEGLLEELRELWEHFFFARM